MAGDSLELFSRSSVSRQRRKPTPRRRFRSAILRVVFLGFKPYCGARTWSSVQATGRRLGTLAWKLSGRDRRRALAHLEIAFPEQSDVERLSLARASARALGMNATEILHLVARGVEEARRHLSVVGWEHVEAALSASGSVMITTAHCGNWELLGPAFRLHDQLLHALVRGQQENWMAEAVSDYRRRLGTVAIARGEAGSAARLLGVRRSGGALAVLVDQDIRADSVFVPFFGRPAHTPVGPAEMALRWDLPVVPAFAARLPDGSHTLTFHRPLEERADAEALTAAVTHAIEAQIRRHPEQWVWAHRRWRRRPQSND